MKGVIRIVVWAVIVLLILLVLYPILKPRFLLYRVRNNPLFREFDKCTLVSNEFKYENVDKFTWKKLYTRKYTEIIFSFRDTLSEHRIVYNYRIFVHLNCDTITGIFLEGDIPLTEDKTVRKTISDMEQDSSLAQVIACSDVKECHKDYWNFLFTGKQDTIKYANIPGVTYFKLSNTPGRLSALSHFNVFRSMTEEKGFALADFDSLRYLKHSHTWRMQAYCSQCSLDIVEVGNYAVSQAHLKWLSKPDTINPNFLKTKVFNKLLATGLTKDYINKKMFLEEKGATRLADYYKRGDKIIEASRIVGYFKYRWRTDSWIDKLHGGLKLKIYFTYFMNRRDLETIRIGLSPSNFHDRITLHPLDNIVDYDVITRISSEIDTTDLNFKIRQNGNIVITFVYDKHTYEVDVETGDIKKERYWGVGMSCCPPYDRHLYGQMEGQVNGKRDKKP